MGFFSRKSDRQVRHSAQPSKSTRGSVNESAHESDSLHARREDDELDSAALHKRRARRRLIGAIALVLGAIVFLPMLFDAEPQRVAEDISVQIPDKDAPRDLPKETPVAPPSPAASVASASSVAGVASVAPLIPPQAPSARSLALNASPTVAVKPAAPTVPPPSALSSKPLANDSARAQAILEGQEQSPSHNTQNANRVLVQIGAFSDAQKANQLRDQIRTRGLKTAYTEVVATTQGPRTRVRVGPFNTTQEAERAREQLKKMGLNSSIAAQ